MPASVVLFRTRTVAVLKRAGGSTVPADLGTTCLVLPGTTVTLSDEAADLLASYLRVINAYFRPRAQKPIIKLLHDQISQRLSQHRECFPGPVPRSVVADLIARLGCASDWHQLASGSGNGSMLLELPPS